MRKNISNSEKTSECNPLSINRVVKLEMVIEGKVHSHLQVCAYTLDNNNF